VLAASTITQMMEAANTSEMSINFYHTTQCNTSEANHLQLYQFFSENSNWHSKRHFLNLNNLWS
jgi:hypothetical protein